MNTGKGNRKLFVTKLTAAYMLLGLLVTLVAAGYFKMEPATCVQAYLVFAAGLLGKDVTFNWGNAQEHKHAAEATKTEDKP